MRFQTQVGLVHWSMPPTVGGVESHLADFAALLAGTGVRVTVFTGTPNPRPIDGVRVVSHPLLNLSEGEARAAAARSAAGRSAPARIRAHVRELVSWFRQPGPGPTVIHGHNLHYFSPAPALALAELRAAAGIRVLHTYHSVWNDDGVHARICRDWDGHYTVSDYLRRQCLAQLGIATRRLYLGVNTERFRPAPRRPEPHREPVILHPARLVPDKGADQSVRMLAHLLEQGIAARLVLTDTDDLVDWEDEHQVFRAKLDQLIAELDLADRVEFRAATFDQMPELYQRADVVVHPSTYPEPLGLAALEAMCAGRPVVTTRLGGLAEAVQDGRTGYVVTPGDITVLVRRVAALLRDPALARRMGDAGRRRVLAGFTLDAYLTEMLAEYRAR
jgi:glycosyltransferase involved in cell wall biosynthesis